MGLLAPQHFLYFLPLPHGQRSFRLTDVMFYCPCSVESLDCSSVASTASCLLENWVRGCEAIHQTLRHMKYSGLRSRLQLAGGLERIDRRLEILSANLIICVIRFGPNLQ